MYARKNYHKRGMVKTWLLGLVYFATLSGVSGSLLLPEVIENRISGSEASALQSMRTVATAQLQYKERFGFYAVHLKDLQAEGYVDKDLGSGAKDGYEFGDVKLTMNNGWQLTAEPSQPGRSGTRYFFVDQTGVIRYSSLGVANKGDPRVQSARD